VQSGNDQRRHRRISRPASWVRSKIRIIRALRWNRSGLGSQVVLWYIALFTPTIRKGNRVRAEILKIHADSPEASLIKYAAEQIQAGKVLGMPTDTFYGLAADPFNLRAVERVYEIKSRSRHKPLSLLIENVDQAEEFGRSVAGRLPAFWRGVFGRGR